MTSTAPAAAIVDIGGTGIEHQVQDTDTLKLAYDFANGWQAVLYSPACSTRTMTPACDSWLRDPPAPPSIPATATSTATITTSPPAPFPTMSITGSRPSWRRALTLTSAPDGDFAWEMVASRYDYLNDKQRVPTAALPGAFTGGRRHHQPHERHRLVHLGRQWRLARLDGPRNVLRPASRRRDLRADPQQPHRLDRGRHRQRGQRRHRAAPPPMPSGCRISGPCCRTSKRRSGLRYEDWRAYDGSNFSAAPPLNVSQPRISASTFSPKASLAWQISDRWR